MTFIFPGKETIYPRTGLLKTNYHRLAASASLKFEKLEVKSAFDL